MPDVFVRFALAADLTGAERERLRELAAQRAGVGKRTLDSMLKEARSEAKSRREARRRRDEQRAARRDPTPTGCGAVCRMPNGCRSCEVLNEAHAASKADEPPMRDRDNDLAQISGVPAEQPASADRQTATLISRRRRRRSFKS